MKAIVKKEPKVGLWLEERPVPKISPNDLLIKIEKTAICGTDLHLYEWDAWAQKNLPLGSIIGHEFSGKVVKIGDRVSNFKIGQRVSGEGHITCGKCRPCLLGQKVLCPQTIGIGVHRDGCFAEYLCLPAENAFPLPKEISDEVASIYDPFGNTVHTALSFDLVGQDVLITGAGPIGLMAIAVAKKAGARYVVISDINPYRLSLAKKMGATRAVNIKKQSLTKVQKDLGIVNGFDVCMEMSGSAEALQSLPDLAAHGGHIVLLGILPQDTTLDWHKVIFKMLTLKGIYGREIFRTWYQATHLLQSGLDITPIITHRFAAEDFQEGFDAMLSGQCGKVILDWT